MHWMRSMELVSKKVFITQQRQGINNYAASLITIHAWQARGLGAGETIYAVPCRRDCEAGS